VIADDADPAAVAADWVDRLWQALWHLQRIRNRTLGLAQERHVFYADFFDHVDDLSNGHPGVPRRAPARGASSL
jgi:hypothetical protein